MSHRDNATLSLVKHPIQETELAGFTFPNIMDHGYVFV